MGQRLLWIEDELAGQLDILNDVVKINNEDIKKIIKRLSDESTNMNEVLDENVLQFKLKAKQIRDTYAKVVDEEIDQIYEAWEEYETKRNEIKNKMTTLTKSIGDVRSDICELRKQLGELNVYGVDKVLEVIHKFETMPAAEKQLLKDLINSKTVDQI